jgi:hypothetical protein
MNFNLLLLYKLMSMNAPTLASHFSKTLLEDMIRKGIVK